MEDQSGVRGATGRDEEPDRPLREPAPIHRPAVDPDVVALFSRPEGVSGGFDPTSATGAVGSADPGVVRDADPALAQAFGPGPESPRGIERHPEWQDEAAAPPARTPDPWRDPQAPVGLGAPAVAATPEPRPVDLSGADEAPPARLSLSEALFERRLSRRALAGAIAAVAVVALAGGAIGAVVADSARVLTTSTVRIADAPDNVLRPDNPVGEVARRVQPAVVNIQVSTPSARGEGSGIVIDPQGYIVTNNHVVTMDGAADRADIDVIFPDGSRAAAEMVGRDPATDLAVLKVEDVQNLTVATLGNSDDVQVAERAGSIALQTRQRIAGVIENMSWLELPDGTRMDVFGTGGGAEVAANLSRSVGAPVKLLGQVPLEQAVREHGDEGTPIVLAEPESPSGRAYREIADGLAVRPRGLAGMNLGIDTTRHL